MLLRFLHRLFSTACVVFGAVTLVFLVLYWLPGDPADLVAGEDANEATVARIRARLGTDRPLFDQYTDYIGKLAHGDLGSSFSTNEPVTRRLLAQVPATLELAFTACPLALAGGVVLGLICAVNRGRWPDHAIQTTLLVFTSMPSFWLGILLILLFSVTLRWLPAIGNGSLAQLVLPVACLSIIVSGRLARIVRNSVLDVLHEPFVATLRGKGLTERQVLYRHVLRNALIPVVTIFGLLVSELLSGAVVVETLFARQGLGRLLAEAVNVKDIPMVLGTTLLASFIFGTVNLLIDLSYGFIDPRIDS